MTDQDIIDTIAVALAGEANADLAGLDAAAVLAALRSAGYAIVELPEPYPPDRGWMADLDIPDAVCARSIAAALLAEADAVEVDQ